MFEEPEKSRMSWSPLALCAGPIVRVLAARAGLGPLLQATTVLLVVALLAAGVDKLQGPRPIGRFSGLPLYLVIGIL